MGLFGILITKETVILKMLSNFALYYGIDLKFEISTPDKPDSFIKNFIYQNLFK